MVPGQIQREDKGRYEKKDVDSCHGVGDGICMLWALG